MVKISNIIKDFIKISEDYTLKEVNNLNDTIELIILPKDDSTAFRIYIYKEINLITIVTFTKFFPKDKTVGSILAANDINSNNKYNTYINCLVQPFSRGYMVLFETRVQLSVFNTSSFSLIALNDYISMHRFCANMLYKRFLKYWNGEIEYTEIGE